MDKKEAKKEESSLLRHIGYLERAAQEGKDRIAELRAIIDAPEPDPSKWVGKLCVFSDGKSMEVGHISILASLEDAVHGTKYHHDSSMSPSWYCRPSTRAEVEALIYEEPKKYRYDWSKAPKDAVKATTDADGTVCFWVKDSYPVPLSGGKWWSKSSYGLANNNAATTGESCPDWRESLEERPEEFR